MCYCYTSQNLESRCFTNMETAVQMLTKSSEEHALGPELVQGRARVQTQAPRLGFWKEPKGVQIGVT